MKNKLFLICLLVGQIITAQVKSQTSPIQFQGKSVNAFTIEVQQKLDFVEQLFNSKFEIDLLGETKKSQENFIYYQQVRLSKIASSFLDVYYQIEETKSDNASSVRISLLISKGYDNFISNETDSNASKIILEMLNDIGLSVERKNFDILITKKEQDLKNEKQKLILLENELQVIENEKIELEKKRLSKAEILKSQARTTQLIGAELQKIKTSLSDFEKNTNNKSKAVLNTISKL